MTVAEFSCSPWFFRSAVADRRYKLAPPTSLRMTIVSPQHRKFQWEAPVDDFPLINCLLPYVA
jgi:hypothetical protein